jgi:hypothetical protein
MAPNLGGNLHGYLTLGENPSRDERMTDYYPLIARAVEELGTSTGEARQALYERARNAVAQLRSKPAKECLALEEAIRTVEAEAAGKSRTEKRTKPQSAAPTESTPDDGAQLASKSPWRHRADPPPAGPPGAGGSAVLPTAREQLLSGRSSRKRKAVKGDVVRDGPDLGATTAKATQTARLSRQPYEGDARQYPPAKEYFDTLDYSGDYAAREERDLEPAYEPDHEQPVVPPPSWHAPRNTAHGEEYERKGCGLTTLPVVLIRASHG